MAQQITRNVYKIQTPQGSSRAGTRASDYATAFSTGKAQQFQLAIQQAKLEYSTIEAQNAYARKAALAAQKELTRQLEGIDDDILRLRKGQISARIAADKFNLSLDASTRRFNAAQRNSTERAQANLDARAAARARAQQKETISSNVDSGLVEEVSDIVTQVGPDRAWDTVVSFAESGLDESGTESLNQKAWILYNKEYSDAKAKYEEQNGEPLSEDQAAALDADIRAKMQPSQLSGVEQVETQAALDDPNFGVGQGPDIQLSGGGVGKTGPIDPRTAETDALIDELLAKRARLESQGVAPATQIPLPNLLRRAQGVQTETFGTYGPGTQVPGYQQQELMEKALGLVRDAINVEISKLPADATPEDIQAARGRGQEEAKRILGYKPTQRTALQSGQGRPFTESDRIPLPEEDLRGLRDERDDIEADKEFETQLAKPKPTKDQQRAKSLAEIALRASQALEQIQAGSLDRDKVFAGKGGKVINQIYDVGSRGDLSFDKIFEATDTYLTKHESPEARAKGLELLLVRNMLDEADKVPE